MQTYTEAAYSALHMRCPCTKQGSAVVRWSYGPVQCQKQHSLLLFFSLALKALHSLALRRCQRGLGKDGAGDSPGDKMFGLTGRLAAVMDSAQPEQCSLVKVAGHAHSRAVLCLIKRPLDGTVRMRSSTVFFVAASCSSLAPLWRDCMKRKTRKKLCLKEFLFKTSNHAVNRI